MTISPTGIIPESLLYGFQLQAVMDYISRLHVDGDTKADLFRGWAQTVGGRAQELTVLATSDPIPNDVVALRPGAPAEMVAAVRSALVSLSQSSDGRKDLDQLFHADAFVPAEDSDYAPLRALR